MRHVIVTENLSYQSFGAISLNRAAELLRRRDAESAHDGLVRSNKQCAVTTVDARAILVNFLKLGVAANPLGRTESRQPYSLLTVSLLRPLARRRFRTRRPFLLLIRTRKPCVRLRWRVFG
jgi:hypothetical protein